VHPRDHIVSQILEHVPTPRVHIGDPYEATRSAPTS